MSATNYFGCRSRSLRSALVAVVVFVTAVGLASVAGAQPAAKDAKSAPAVKAEKPADAAVATKGAAAKAASSPAPKTPPAAPPAKTEEPEPAEAAPSPPVKYQQDISDDDYKKAADRARKEKSIIRKILQAQTFAAGQEAQFDAFYSGFALPRWTVPENYATLPEFRRELRGDLFSGKSGPPYDRLLGLVFDYMTKISGSGYHPAVRFNATMMLGDLNVQELPPGSRERIQPYPGSLKALIGAIRSSDSDAVRVAALLGIHRHAGLGIADAQVREGQLIPLLLDLAKSAPPAGRSSDGHAWLRALAIDILATLHAVGPSGRPVAPSGAVVGALVGIVGDKNAPTLTRCAAARALGAFDYKGFNALTPSQLATPIGQMAVEFCTAELAKTKPATKTVAKTGMRGMGPMMYGGGSSDMSSMPGMMPGMGGPMYGTPGGQKGPNDEDADRLLRLRRSLKYHLNAARLGLNGPNDSQNGGIRLYAAKFETDLKKLADFQDPDWRFVNGVFGAIQEHIRALDGDEEEYSTLAKKVSAARTKLRDLVNPPGADKAPAKSPPATPAKK